MKLSTKAFSLTLGLVWAGAMLVVGLIHLADAQYGGEFLRLMSSVYPGADTSRTIGSVLIGTLYGFVDGAVGGAIMAWLYGLISRRHWVA